MFIFGFIIGFVFGYFFEIKKEKREKLRKILKRNKTMIISPKTHQKAKVEDLILANDEKGVDTPIEELYEK